MNDNSSFAIGTLPGWLGQPKKDAAAQKIHDGIQTACLEVADRIERSRETATDKELIDLSLCLSGLITAWNLAAMHTDYGAYPPIANGCAAPAGDQP